MSRTTALFATFALLLAACGARDAGKTRWRFAIEETRGSVQDAYAQRFAELIERKSNGEIDVITYPIGALGTSDQTTEQLYNQTIQFVMASPGHLGKMIPEVQVFLLHFLFSGDPDIDNRALADPDLRASFDRLYSEKNFRLLTFFTEGEMVWTTKSRIDEPSDFQGVKMRVMTSPLLIAAYAAYGASPTPLPYTEVYSGLQLNMIDGQVNPIFAIEEMGFYEVTDYLIFPGHAQFITSVMTNADWYASLTGDQQQLVDETIAELQPYILEVQKRFNGERLDTIVDKSRARGHDLEVVRLTDEQRAVFRDQSEPVKRQFVADTGGDAATILEQVEQAVARAR